MQGLAETQNLLTPNTCPLWLAVDCTLRNLIRACVYERDRSEMTSFVVIYGVIIHQLTWTLTRTRHLFTKRSQRLVSPSLRQPVCLLYLETWKSDVELLLLLLLGKVGWRGSSAALSWQQLGIQKTWKERVKFQNKRSCSHQGPPVPHLSVNLMCSSVKAH